MNQFLNRTAGQAKTTDPLVSPVTAQEVQDWLVLPGAEPTIPALLKSATGAVIRFLGYDLLARDWTLTHWDWPTIGTSTSPSLSGQNGELQKEIKLPYANLLSISSVSLFGQTTTDFITRIESIVFDPYYVHSIYTGQNEDPAIVAQYRAGYGETADDIPEDVKQAILQLAAFNFEHRGSCDATQALMKSGAREMLQPYVAPENVVIY